MQIENTQSSMVQLWLRLERTEMVLRASCRRFCPRTILKQWFAARANDDFIFDVCLLSKLAGYEELLPVRRYPRKPRDFLQAVIAVTCGIGMRKIDLRALDRAFSEAFPHVTRINVNKKKSS